MNLHMIDSRSCELVRSVPKLCASFLAALVAERAQQSEVLHSKTLEEHRQLATSGGKAPTLTSTTIPGVRTQARVDRAPARDALLCEFKDVVGTELLQSSKHAAVALRESSLDCVLYKRHEAGDKIYFLGRVIERTARGYSESLVELEGERRAMYRTVVGKLLYMCQERADVMYSVKETARKITCPTESDEMNLKRIVRYLKGAPSAKSLIEIITPSKFVNVYKDSDWAGQATTCKSTSGGVVQW